MLPSVIEAPSCLRGADENVMQRRPADRDRRRIIRTAQARHVERADRMAAGVGEHDPVEAVGHVDALIDQADRLERAQRRSGQADADAEDVPCRLQLDHIDGDVAAPERDGERQARDTAADDEDLAFVAHGAPRVTAASGWPP